MLSIRTLRKSLRFAFQGLRTVSVHEHSFRVHVLALVALVIVISLLRVTVVETALLLIVTMIVLVLELVNSIFERFIDMVEPRVGAQVRDLKDIMAGAVLITSVGALVIGLIIIVPYLTF